MTQSELFLKQKTVAASEKKAALCYAFPFFLSCLSKRGTCEAVRFFAQRVHRPRTAPLLNKPRDSQARAARGRNFSPRVLSPGCPLAGRIIFSHASGSGARFPKKKESTGRTVIIPSSLFAFVFSRSFLCRFSLALSVLYRRERKRELTFRTRRLAAFLASSK